MHQLKEQPPTHNAAPEGKSGDAPHPHHISAGKVFVAILLLAAMVAAIALAGYLPRKKREEAAGAAASSERNTLPSVTSALVRRAPADTTVALPGDLSPLLESSI